mmetsp:Transcript_25687/g.72749  ORF Transcript_25687/g.72749 Transcript_25687/m.72749 type:complete len:242 (+) Transcript_25687:188-913(+)
MRRSSTCPPSGCTPSRSLWRPRGSALGSSGSCGARARWRIAASRMPSRSSSPTARRSARCSTATTANSSARSFKSRWRSSAPRRESRSSRCSSASSARRSGRASRRASRASRIVSSTRRTGGTGWTRSLTFTRPATSGTWRWTTRRRTSPSLCKNSSRGLSRSPAVRYLRFASTWPRSTSRCSWTLPLRRPCSGLSWRRRNLPSSARSQAKPSTALQQHARAGAPGESRLEHVGELAAHPV